MKFILPLIFFFAAVSVSFLPKNNAGRNPIGTANPNTKPPSFSFQLLPGERVEFKMSYSAYFQHVTRIKEGSYMREFIKSQGDAPQSHNYIRENRTTQPISFYMDDSAMVSGTGPGSGNSGPPPVYKITYIRVHEERDNYTKVGWEDFTDGDFNDALVEIIISRL